ncbi:MAG: hypothetical protein LBJ21_10170, partial [Acidobacteriota bacterium]|jgi:hypothetical protein|nr:hypothetical protein [Acidobacteriota bacterium]
MVSGSQQIRNAYGSQLATGNFVAIASGLATHNGSNFGILAKKQMSDVNGLVLREGGAPENLIFTNPQYLNVYLKRSREHSNYHSMQAQVTMRPTHGLSFQATYTWSRNLQRPANKTDWHDWSADYWLAGQHRSHALNVNGTYALPFGANGFVLRNATGAIKKTVEGWQIGWIASVTSGPPMSLTGVATLWNNGSLNLVRPDLWDSKSGNVEWDNEAGEGFYYGKNYTRVIDPMCFEESIVAVSLRTACANGIRALVLVDDSKDIAGWTNVNRNDASAIRGTVIFQNPKPGERGNFQPNNLTGVGRWNLDANMGKTIEFMEGKRLELRVDAQNIFNHATPSQSGASVGARGNTVTNPFLTVNTTAGTQFGLLSTKTGHRTFQARIRLSF